jgi:hypothetical protein
MFSVRNKNACLRLYHRYMCLMNGECERQGMYLLTLTLTRGGGGRSFWAGGRVSCSSACACEEEGKLGCCCLGEQPFELT